VRRGPWARPEWNPTTDGRDRQECAHEYHTGFVTLPLASRNNHHPQRATHASSDHPPSALSRHHRGNRARHTHFLAFRQQRRLDHPLGRQRPTLAIPHPGPRTSTANNPPLTLCRHREGQQPSHQRGPHTDWTVPAELLFLPRATHDNSPAINTGLTHARSPGPVSGSYTRKRQRLSPQHAPHDRQPTALAWK
jgi:hypothetical protein